MPSIGSSVQNCRRRFAAAAIDQAADFFRRGVGDRRRTKSRDLVSVAMPSSSRSASAFSSPISVEPGNCSASRRAISGLDREVGDRHRRAVVLGERRRRPSRAECGGPRARPRGRRRWRTGLSDESNMGQVMRDRQGSQSPRIRNPLGLQHLRKLPGQDSNLE